MRSWGQRSALGGPIRGQESECASASGATVRLRHFRSSPPTCKIAALTIIHSATALLIAAVLLLLLFLPPVPLLLRPVLPVLLVLGAAPSGGRRRLL